MKQWFFQLKHREQIILCLGAASLLLYISYIAIWQPLHQKRINLVSQNEQTQMALQKVIAMAAEVEALQGSERRQQTNRGSLQQLLNSAAKKHGLTASRIQPNARGEIQMRFESVSADALLAWLHELEQRRGVIVRDATINTTAVQNQLNAAIRLAQGG